jgi:hypothetical protein
MKVMTDKLDMLVKKELWGRQSRSKSFEKGIDIVDILVHEENCLNKDDVCLAEIEHHCTHIVEVPCALKILSSWIRETCWSRNEHVNKCTENIVKGNDMCSMILQGENF